MILAALLAITAFAQGVMDVHSHIITAEFVSALESEGRLMEEGFPLPKYDIQTHLQWMDEAGIATSVLTMPAPQPFSKEAVRGFNEEAARLKREHPGRFKFCAALPLPDVDAAIEEAKYALDVLHADGIKLATNAQGQYLGDPALDPLMEVLNERKAVVILHPHRPEPVNQQVMAQTPLAMQDYLGETTRAVCNMISRNVLTRYPNVKVIIPHCGAYLPLAIPRMKSLTPVMQANQLVGDIDYDANLRALYYDLAGSHSPEVIRMMLTVTTPDHIMYGSDYPYVNTAVLTSQLGRMKDYLDQDPKLAPYRQMFLTENARYLFGDSQEKPMPQIAPDSGMIVRIAEIEVHPQYLSEYLAAAAEIQQKSLAEEPGVICLFPTQTKDDACQIRILEIYASQEAYQHHIETAHFLKYKQGTLQMVKSLKLQDLQPLTPETIDNIFKRNCDMNDQSFESLNSPWPKGEPNTGYAQYFIGNSYLADMGGGVINVTFEPRCRNNWHIHHKQVQVLICVAGRGWYQEWGKEPQEMTPGTVIAIPAEVKHWHGAANDSWFQHLTYHKDVQDGASNEWLEPVMDDIYNQL